MASLYLYNPNTGRATRIQKDSNSADSDGNFKIVYDVLFGYTYILGVKCEFPLDTGAYGISTFLNTNASTYDRDDDGFNNSGGNTYPEAGPITLNPDMANPGHYTGQYTGGIDYEGDFDYYKFLVAGEGSLNVYTEDVDPVIWSAGNTYGRDKIVEHDGAYYKCIVDLSFSPDVFPQSDWTEVEKPLIDTFGYLIQENKGMYTILAMNDDSDYTDDDGFNFGIRHYVTPVNVALGKPSSQSTTIDAPDYDPSAASANDGNLNTINNTECGSAEPWWQVDLESATTINEIKLFNRNDDTHTKLSNFYLFISDSDMSGTSLTDLRNDTTIWQYHQSGDCGLERSIKTTDGTINGSPSVINVTGQYVMVILSGTDCLHMREIEVFGQSVFYVKVKHFSNTEKGDYSFHVDFNSSDKDDHGNDCRTATHVGPKYDHAGNIGIPGDIDIFKFVLGPVGAAGGSLVVNSHDNTIDPFGYLKNGMCSNIIMDDNGLGSNQDFLLSWTQPCDPAKDCDTFPEECCRPEIFNVGIRNYNNKQTGTYELNIDSNGTYIDWNGFGTWAANDGNPHYFGFEMSPVNSNLELVAVNESGTTDYELRLISGDTGTVIEGTDSFEQEANVFRLNRLNLTPGTYYAKVTPTGAPSSIAFRINAGQWNWEQASLGTGYGTVTSGGSEADEFTVTATGDDIWTDGSNYDDGLFLYRHISGDFEMSARIFWVGTPPHEWAKAGIMARVSTDERSKNAFSAFTRDHGYQAQYREVSGSDYSTAGTNYNNALYSYVKLKRQGNTLTSYRSNDGVTWVPVRDSDTISGNILVGMAVSSHHASSPCTVKFQQIEFITE